MSVNRYFLLTIVSTDLVYGCFDEQFPTKEEALEKMEAYRLQYKSNFSAILRKCETVSEVTQEIRLPRKRVRQ
jgi:hypothetical protein